MTDADPMIDTPAALAALAARAKEKGFIALDTEFVWEQTYYPRLGLVQAAFSEHESVLIDTVALEDLSALGPALEDPDVVKILHDPQQDLTILRRASGASAVNVFDTQRAGGFVGLSSTISLADLLSVLFDVHLPKSATRTNWLQRPLSERQVEYALDDVRYLPEAWEVLRERAERHHRLAWMQEEMTIYDDPALYAERDPYEQYQRVSGRGRLNARQTGVLRELTAWREQEARRQDRPRGHVVPDNVLVQLARRTPRDAGDVRRVRGKWDRDRYAAAVVEAVARGLEAGPEERPRRRESPPQDEGMAARIDLMLALLKGKGLAEGVDPQLVATRSDVTALAWEGAGAETDGLLLLDGWRRLFVGDDMLALLEGRRTVRIDAETGLPSIGG